MIILSILFILVGIYAIYCGIDILNDVRNGSDSSGYIFAGIEFILALVTFWFALMHATI